MRAHRWERISGEKPSGPARTRLDRGLPVWRCGRCGIRLDSGLKPGECGGAVTREYRDGIGLDEPASMRKVRLLAPDYLSADCDEVIVKRVMES